MSLPSSSSSLFEEKSIFIPSIQKNILFKIGKNAEGNFRIIDLSKPEDLWFHVGDGLSSEHVVASITNLHNDEFRLDKKQLRDIVTQGCVLCKKHSKYNNKKELEIEYTEIKNVSKTDRTGMVCVKNIKYKHI